MAIRALNTDNALFKRTVNLEDMKRRLLQQQSGQTAGAARNVSASATAVNSTSGTPPATDMAAPAPAAAQPEIRVMGPQEYSTFAHLSPGFRSGMSDADKAAWGAIGAKYNAGDSSWASDTNRFREDANWGSYTDENGNINGWLYAANGVGDYAPAFGGKIGESGYKAGTIFYSPDGKAYTMGADGTLTQSGNVEWAKYGSYVGPKAGYQDSSFWALEDGQYKRYTNQTAPDDVLEAQGYYRDSNGLVMPINDQYRISQAVKNGEITPEQAALAQAMRNGNPGNMPSAPVNTPSNTPSSTTGGGSSYSGSSSQTTPTQAQPIQNQPVQNQPVQTQPTQASPNIYQQYMDQWDYPEAPQWEGSEYQQKRDDALKRAEDMRWDYDPNTDPVWQALQKQYRREGDRATRNAMGEYAARTGGVPSSYAVTAASQAGDYYAAQLSDRLPQLYQDAYQRYLQEFQRQLGISDQYQGFDDREYSRFGDRLQQFNTDRNFDYGRYRDAVGDYRYDDTTAYNRNYQAQRDAVADQRYDQQWAQQLREYADQQNWKATEWQQYLREYGDKMSQQEREWAYQQYRDAVGDERYNQAYADEQAQNAYQRDLANREWDYQLSRDALEDERYDAKWAQALREYDDEQAQQAWNNDYKLSSKSTGGSSGSTGGGSKSGGTKSSGSGAAAPAPASTTAPTSSGNYDKALSDVRAYRNTHSTTEVLQYIKRLINEGTITDDEASQMLLYFGYVTGSGGGGSYAPGSPNNVLMTK